MSYKYTERYKKVDKALREHSKFHGGTFPFGGCEVCGIIAKEWMDSNVEMKEEHRKQVSRKKQEKKRKQ